MGNNLCCLDNNKQNITDDQQSTNKKQQPQRQFSVKKSVTRSIFSKKETSAPLCEEKVTKLEIAQVAADMFGLDEINRADEGYLQFMSNLFKNDDVIRFQVSFNTFKFSNFHFFVRHQTYILIDSLEKQRSINFVQTDRY